MNEKDTLQVLLDESLAFQIDHTSNFNKTFRRVFHTKYMDSNISPDEFAILCLIKIRPDITQASIAKLLFKGKAHVGKILNAMEEKGFLKREHSKHSNTTKNTISKNGESILKKGLVEIKKVENAISETFSKEEINQFFSFLKKYKKTLNSIVDVKLK